MEMAVAKSVSFQHKRSVTISKHTSKFENGST